MTRLIVVLMTLAVAMMGNVTQLPGWFTIPDFAKKVGFSEWTIRKEIAAGSLRARRVGRCVRVLDVDGAEWMRGREKAS